jgi:uncharacterized damage-inducible protein DinB
MIEHQLSLAPFYTGWDVYQKQLVAAIAPLTVDQLALRSSPLNWSIGMITTHIVGARTFWFHTRIGEGSDDLAQYELWDYGVCEDGEDPLHSAAELIAGLERTWQMIEEALARLTPADLGKVFPHPKGGNRPVRSLQWIIWHVLEHDIHHGGELSSILGAHGLAAVDLD